jgi:CDP-diacylglycerol--serine O-phosphatidyltransferase
MEPSAAAPSRMRRGGYLLPSAFTIGNILLGFYAVVRGYRGDFQMAALLILTAGVLDGLDGRIARLTGTESEFGKEYDSLADVLTFGAAPALLAFFWGLQELGRIGFLAPFFYVVCTATRLARFNVQTRVVDKRYFVGLPSPAAAGGIASFLFFSPDHEWKPWAAAFLIGALVAVGMLMVSTFRYRSFKGVDLRRRWSYRATLPIAAVLLVAAYHPPAFFLAAAVVYTLSGPLAWVASRLSRRHAPSPPPPAEPPPAPWPPEEAPREDF